MLPYKKYLRFFFFLSALFVAYKLFVFVQASSRRLEFTAPKNIAINDNGLVFATRTAAKTAGDVLQEKNIVLNDRDQVIPEKAAAIFPGNTLLIRRAVPIKILVDGKTVENWTLSPTILGALAENNVTLGRLDIVEPASASVPLKNSIIKVTRINVEEKVVAEDIDFKTISNTDAKMGWREQKITQTGVKGIREVKYRITYKNSKEVNRVALEKKVTQEPVSQIVTQGTHMELGKAAKGQGTWYAFKGGLFAASTTLPRGSYAKVTNTATGQSVVVEINDYGPFGKGRIIDLDKVAFQKIAPLGAGVIGVKVEPVLN